uniref:Coiled-coil domain-containing protein 93 n=1 Tax=Salarias fasciatus TaxID=181472 RepID=A0A672IGT6_SALFA
LILPRGVFGISVETREDEEQSVKLGEILELLLAAGYFRARIKGLSPFDKVVGGMTWCITTCNFDIDVDLLFQENATIGQKIALTEKIVSVLPKMKCPHRLEPHQIQGLDFIHIFPVIQWLVKRAIETREEMGDYVRAYSISQFQKNHRLPEDEEFLQRRDGAVRAVLDVMEVYKPQRKYRRQRGAEVLTDEESRVHSTLLEYGRSAVCLLNIFKWICGLMTSDLLVSPQQSERSSEERSERYGPLQQHRRAVASLNKHIQQKTKELSCTSCISAALSLQTVTLQELSLPDSAVCVCVCVCVCCVCAGGSHSVLEKLRALVTMNESLKQQEQEFRAHCRVREGDLPLCLRFLGSGSSLLNLRWHCVFQERNELIDKQYNADREKLQKIRLLMARRNREIAILQRKIDEVPSRAELTQYQKRFIELYSHVSATHKETKQFFTLYNTLDDKKVYLEKEVNLLNSIHDNFQQAMASSAAKEQFLRQMEQIVEGIKHSRIKMEKKKQENKMRRDQLNDEYLELLDKQRLYFKTVKDFKEECRKNEMLLSKLRAKGAS